MELPKIIVRGLLVMVGLLTMVGRPASAADNSLGTTEQASITSNGTQSNGDSFGPSISADGRFVAFFSYASNLVSGDGNGRSDVFVRDRLTGDTQLVSVASDGTLAGNGFSNDPSISGNGRYVAFTSEASNLVSGDTNGKVDVFVFDREMGITRLVSLAGDGTPANGMSGNPSFSADGSYVAFSSLADNLVSGDTNGCADIFVYDLLTGALELVSLDPNGDQFDKNLTFTYLSSDGRFVLFASETFVIPDPDDWFITFVYELYVRDRLNNLTEKLNIACQAGWDCQSQMDGSITADGRFVAFSAGPNSAYPNQVFVYDRSSGVTELVSDGEPEANSDLPIISPDGRYVSFTSWDNSLFSGDLNAEYDVFVFDRLTRHMGLVSQDSAGMQGNGASFWSAISANGRFIAFVSAASNLVSNDTNGKSDIFVRDRGAEMWLLDDQLFLPLVVR